MSKLTCNCGNIIHDTYMVITYKTQIICMECADALYLQKLKRYSQQQKKIPLRLNKNKYRGKALSPVFFSKKNSYLGYNAKEVRKSNLLKIKNKLVRNNIYKIKKRRDVRKISLNKITENKVRAIV